MIIFRIFPRFSQTFSNNRRWMAYFTSPATRSEPRAGVTAILFLHHGEPSTIDEAVEFRTNRAISFYALPAFVKEYLLKLAEKRDLRRKLQPYFKEPSQLIETHKKQGAALETALQQLLPELGPYKFYAGYLWSEPRIERVLDDMRRDSVSRVFVFPQYPHYWCFQSGFCINELARQKRLKTSAIDGRRPYCRYWGAKEEIEKDRASDREPRGVEWSLIDRWPAHPALTDAYSQLIKSELVHFPYDIRHEVAILFCAPYSRFYDAADYRREVAATCLRISESLDHRHPYKLAWFNSWTQWSIPIVGMLNGGQHGLAKSMSNLVEAGRSNVLIVPLPYTTPTIDTEVVLKSMLRDDVLKRVGVHYARFVRPPGDSSTFIHGLAEIVKNHYLNDSRTSSQFSIRCRKCVWPVCDNSRRIFAVQ